jgi:hypothetical protein
MTAGKNELFNCVSSRRYAKSYLKGLLKIVGTVRNRLRDSTEQAQNETQNDGRRQILRTDRIPQKKELLRRIQEPEYRTEVFSSSDARLCDE